MKKTCISLLYLILGALSQNAVAQQCYLATDRNFCLDANEFSVYGLYSAGDSIGIYQNYAAAGLYYAPCLCPCSYGPTFDTSVLFFNDGSLGASAEVGIRTTNFNDSVVGGVNVFYGYREGYFGDFHQLGINFEIIGNCFEFRANGYFPISNDVNKGPKTIFNDYDNTGAETPYIVTVREEEVSLIGMDIEGGLKYCFQAISTYAGIGAYYFENNSYIDTWGVKGRLRAECGSLFSIDGQVTWDDCNKTKGRIGVEANIPFSAFCDFCKTLCLPCKSQRRSFRDLPIHLERCCKYKTNY